MHPTTEFEYSGEVKEDTNCYKAAYQMNSYECKAVTHSYVSLSLVKAWEGVFRYLHMNGFRMMIMILDYY